MACGRNSGALPRSYPGTEKFEELLLAGKPKCLSFDLKRLHAAAVVSGKERLTSERRGRFHLEAYRISQVLDRADRSVPSSALEVSDFDDIESRAPRLAIVSKCEDLKGNSHEFSVSPIKEFDSFTGFVFLQQPLSVLLTSEGGVTAKSKVPVKPSQIFPIGKLPEAAILLGPEYISSFKTLSFQVRESEDGTLISKGEFIGVDTNLTRVFIQVEAIYSWDSAE